MKRQGEEEQGSKEIKGLFFDGIETLLLLPLDSNQEMVPNLFLLKCKT
jgi:hypothetical protein